MKCIGPKQQVVYIPPHANGDEDHSDCEAGFVTSVYRENGRIVFVRCRFWGENGLDTTSKGCSPESLIAKDTRPQELVDKAYYRLGYE